MSDTTKRLKVSIKGRVQGVGFRYSTREEANRLGLSGWVRNTPDGRVEAEFEGAEEDLRQMLHWCQHGPGVANVRDVDAEWEEGPSRHSGFSVRG
jgi:acylphosphatase